MSDPAKMNGASAVVVAGQPGVENGVAANPHGLGQGPDADIRYMKEKRIPQLMETIAAELIVHKPADPEGFLKNRFFVSSDEKLGGPGAGAAGSSVEEDAVLHCVILCPWSAIAKMAAVVSSARVTPRDYSEPNPRSVSNVSPFGRAPAIEHTGLVVLETGPVVRYLTHQTPYFPSTLRQRVKVESAFDTIVANLIPEASVAVNERHFTPKRNNRPVDLAAVQQAASRFRSQLVAFLNGPFFAESQWVAGRDPSIADMALAAAIFSIHAVAGFDCISGLSKVEKWWEEVQKERFYAIGLSGFRDSAMTLHR